MKKFVAVISMVLAVASIAKADEEVVGWNWNVSVLNNKTGAEYSFIANGTMPIPGIKEAFLVVEPAEILENGKWQHAFVKGWFKNDPVFTYASCTERRGMPQKITLLGGKTPYTITFSCIWN